MQRSAVPVEGVEFTDRYGDTRLIHHNHGPNGPLRVQRTSVTPALAMNPIVAHHLGENVRHLRILRGYSQVELAERAGLRGGKQAIYKIEHGSRGEGMRLGTLYALASALGVSTSALLPSVQRVMKDAGVRDDHDTPRLAVK